LKKRMPFRATSCMHTQGGWRLVQFRDSTLAARSAACAGVSPIASKGPSVVPEAMDELRDRFSGCRDIDLQRFLDQADGSTKTATANFEKHLRWRASQPSVQELRRQADVELRKGKVYLRGKTKTGLPILWWETGRNDPKTRDVDQAALAASYVAMCLPRAVLVASGPLGNKTRATAFCCRAARCRYRCRRVRQSTGATRCYTVLRSGQAERTCRSLVSTHHFTLRDWARRQQAAPGVGALQRAVRGDAHESAPRPRAQRELRSAMRRLAAGVLRVLRCDRRWLAASSVRTPTPLRRGSGGASRSEPPSTVRRRAR
jgi:hypothetical protein